MSFFLHFGKASVDIAIKNKRDIAKLLAYNVACACESVSVRFARVDSVHEIGNNTCRSKVNHT